MTPLTQQTEDMTERLPGSISSKHTFVKTCVLLTSIMTHGIRKQTLSPRNHYQRRFSSIFQEIETCVN